MQTVSITLASGARITAVPTVHPGGEITIDIDQDGLVAGWGRIVDGKIVDCAARLGRLDGSETEEAYAELDTALRDSTILLTCEEWDEPCTLAALLAVNAECPLDADDAAALRELAVGESTDIGPGGVGGTMRVTRVAQWEHRPARVGRVHYADGTSEDAIIGASVSIELGKVPGSEGAS